MPTVCKPLNEVYTNYQYSSLLPGPSNRPVLYTASDQELDSGRPGNEATSTVSIEGTLLVDEGMQRVKVHHYVLQLPSQL